MEEFPELSTLYRVLELSEGLARIENLGTVSTRGIEFPIYSLVIGSEDRTKPVLGLFGGVHGLERIGSQCVLAYLESLFEQMKWDKNLRERFQSVRIACIPIINPLGMYFGSRSNFNGVDLMRNSPSIADKKPPFLIGGHRISKKLPWYRGPEGVPMEYEAQLVVDFVKKELFPSEAALILDVHSGFGIKDRLWYPYARTTSEFPQIKSVDHFVKILNRSHPNHVYLVEPQSVSYTTHGDLWDYIFDSHVEEFGTQKLFIPWTLEMGSWIWVKKNPFQLISGRGLFNPVKEHRYKRTLRRHMPLFDFFLRAALNHENWQGKNV
jgi:hypothetical protein